MAQPYIGEIRMFAGTFAPVGWAFCDGQPMAISENEALFQLIGTTYGGDGEETFNLPNLQSRIPLHMGTGPDGTTYQIAEAAGTEQETLSIQQIPVHGHAVVVSSAAASQVSPADAFVGQSATVDLFVEDAAISNLGASVVAPVGGSQPHTNLQPYLCINYIISLFGIFPSQT
jgi:microcystin-dependent protein